MWIVDRICKLHSWFTVFWTELLMIYQKIEKTARKICQGVQHWQSLPEMRWCIFLHEQVDCKRLFLVHVMILRVQNRSVNLDSLSILVMLCVMWVVLDFTQWDPNFYLWPFILKTSASLLMSLKILIGWSCFANMDHHVLRLSYHEFHSSKQRLDHFCKFYHCSIPLPLYDMFWRL